METPFQPIWRVEIYEAAPLSPSGHIVVGEALSNGTQGQLQVFDVRFQQRLTDLFTEPLLIFGIGGTTPDGLAVDGLRKLPPWQLKTLCYILRYELPNVGLEGRLIALT